LTIDNEEKGLTNVLVQKVERLKEVIGMRNS
jgi:hypothetical protein